MESEVKISASPVKWSFLIIISLGLVILRAATGTPIISSEWALILLACGSVILAGKIPSLGAALHALAQVTLYLLGFYPQILVLGTLFLIGYFAALKHSRSALMLGTVVFTFEGFSQQLPSPSIGLLSVWAVIAALLASAITGRLTGRWFSGTVKRFNQNQRNNELTSEILHDSVASELTSLIMKLEKLAVSDTSNAKELRSAAESARNAMLNTRYLLSALGGTNSLESQTQSFSVADAVKVNSLKLKSHGFRVEDKIQITQPHHLQHISRVVEQCLREATSNIIKYAPAHSVVTLEAYSSVNGIHLVLQNKYSGDTAGKHADITNGLGLAAMEKAVRSVHGIISFGQEKGLWTVSIIIPGDEPQP